MFSKKIYIIFSPLEDKIHIFAPAFNFLYIVYIYLVLVNDELSEDKPVSSEEEEMSEQRSKTKPNRSNASKGNLFQPVFFFLFVLQYRYFSQLFQCPLSPSLSPDVDIDVFIIFITAIRIIIICTFLAGDHDHHHYLDDVTDNYYYYYFYFYYY